MKIPKDISFVNFLSLFRKNEISQRTFITVIKQRQYLQDSLNKQTSFLNGEDNPVDILERLYYVINNIDKVVVCPYCGKKLKFLGRLDKPYYTTCGNKECVSKELAKKHIGNNIISESRNIEFITWHDSVTTLKDLNDDIIKKNICYDKYITLITNPIIKKYLDNRFIDSESYEETLKRIELKIEKKPICPICGNPVTFVGRKKKMYTTYCSNECAGKSTATIQKKKQTQLNNWGTENCYDSEKYKDLVRTKYGVDYISQIPAVIKKRKNTFLQKYGVEYVSQNNDIQHKIWETYKEHQTFNTSNKEEEVYKFLVGLGYNVIRHVKNEIYPFNVDYYLPDYNVYIEYQGSQYHYNRAYLGSNDDKKELDILKAKAENKKQETEKIISQYDAIIDTWTKRDVYKRFYAYKNNINLLEIFYYENIDDIKRQVKLYLDALNSKINFAYEQTVLKAEFDYYKKLRVTDIDKFIGYSVKQNKIVKHFQFNNFYKAEIKIYASNPILRRKLIQNRIKYLNKKENELTVSDIFSGFKKSGIYYGYSHFNSKLTNWFVNKFNIKTIYDPCGGWGHHMLGMLSCDKIIYNDLSETTYKCMCDIKDYFMISNLECHNEDARVYIPENVDAWFMCPPYYNLENYECKPFDNIDDYALFLKIIFDIWYKSNTKLFGLVIREDYFRLLPDCYQDMVFESHIISMNTSHLIKSKKYKEYFYIFQNRLSKIEKEP